MSKDSGGLALNRQSARLSQHGPRGTGAAQPSAPEAVGTYAPEPTAPYGPETAALASEPARVLAGQQLPSRGHRWAPRSALALLPLQRVLGNQTVVRLLDRPSSGPLVQRVYLREPMVTIGKVRQDFSGYDQLQETIRKYQVAVRKSSDAKTLLPLLAAIQERFRDLPQILPSELYKNYQTLVEEVTAEELRLSVAQPQAETVPSQTAQTGPTPTQKPQTQTPSQKATTQTPNQTSQTLTPILRPTQGLTSNLKPPTQVLTSNLKPPTQVLTPTQKPPTQTLTPTQKPGSQPLAPTEASGAPNLLVTGAEISRLVASLIGISVDQLTQERKTRGSLAQIAMAHEVSAKEVALGLHQVLHRLVDKRVKEGGASQAEGDLAKQTMDLTWVTLLMRKGASADQPAPIGTPEPGAVVSSSTPRQTPPLEPGKSSAPTSEPLISSGTTRDSPAKQTSPTGEPLSTITPSVTPRGAVVTNAPRKTIPVSTITSSGSPTRSGGSARQEQVGSTPAKVEINSAINEPARTKSAEPWASDPAGYLERMFKMTIVSQKTEPAEESIRPGRNARKEWRSEELAVIAATLSKLGKDASVLEGVGLERVSTLPPLPGKTSANRVDAGRFSYVVGTPGIAGNRFYMTDRAYQDLESTQGGPSDTVDTIVHEVGHAIESEAARRASWVANETTEKLIRAKADEAVIDKKTDDKARDFERAKAAYASKSGTDADKQQALLYQGEYTLLEAERGRVEQVRMLARKESDQAQLDLEKVYDVKTGKSRCLLNFEKFVRSESIKATLTDYAATNWPARPQEFYAEAYMLWIIDKGKLKAHSQALYDYFASGQYHSSTQS